MRSSAFVAAIVALVLGVSTTSSAQLGEIARQEEARRKTVKSPGKVYTNESLRPEPSPSPGPVAPSAPVATAPAEPPAPAGGGVRTAEEFQQDEAGWRRRIADAREALQRAQSFQSALESQINGLTTDFINRDDPAQRAVVAANRDKAMAELERVKKEIQDQTKAVSDIQDEARRAGVPAGWVR